MRKRKRSKTRCMHVQHKNSAVNYHNGKETTSIPVVLGYNRVHHRYEMCDEGFAESVKVKSNAH
jgi:hypothetical protein